MFSSSKKPYTAITVQIERLTSEEYEENDMSGIPDLIEVIRIQESGPTEAARAIRKKLKYGSTHRQLRALSLLDFLLDNGDSRFQRSFADEPLLERLRILPRDDLVDAEVKRKCNMLFRQWAVSYKNTRGLENIAGLSKQLPSRARPSISQSKVLRETEAQANADPFGEEEAPPSPVQARKSSISFLSQLSSSPSSSSGRQRSYSTSQNSPEASKKDKKRTKRRPFNLEKEKGKILETIASASMASTNLLNGLKLINREHQRPSEDTEVMKRFETCKTLRRQVLRYIQLVESDQWIGSLLTANDELIKALMSFEVMDKSVEDDSDSEDEAGGAGGLSSSGPSSRRINSSVDKQFGGLNLGETPPMKPPRPQNNSTSPSNQIVESSGSGSDEEDDDDDDDEDNPFANRNAINA